MVRTPVRPVSCHDRRSDADRGVSGGSAPILALPAGIRRYQLFNPLLAHDRVGNRPNASDGVRPRVLYISYDGASEPLGRSQVVAYLLSLAESCDITLISFEKPADDHRETRVLLDGAGITWIPLRYSRRPPVASTFWDIARGAVMARRVTRTKRVQIVHARSYVSAAIALLSDRRRSWKFLFDIRGFWVDERVEGGIWRRGGPLYRLGKRSERWLFASADALVTLTHASVPQIEAWLPRPTTRVYVIPTCAAIERYGNVPRRAQPRVTWCGSIGTFYGFDAAVRVADAIGRPFTVLTRQVEIARAALGDREADVRSVPHERVPDELAPADIGLCLYSIGFSNLARAPTRFAEYLAAGMVVAVSPGVGDLESLVKEHGVGAVIYSDQEEGIRAAAEELRRLSDDAATAPRCQELATRVFSLEAGVSDYLSVYHDLLDTATEPQSSTENGTGSRAFIS